MGFLAALLSISATARVLENEPRQPRFFDHGTQSGLTAFEAAGYLGLRESEFGAMRPRLLKAGFPIHDWITNRYDRNTIDRVAGPFPKIEPKSRVGRRHLGPCRTLSGHSHRGGSPARIEWNMVGSITKPHDRTTTTPRDALLGSPKDHGAPRQKLAEFPAPRGGTNHGVDPRARSVGRTLRFSMRDAEHTDETLWTANQVGRRLGRSRAWFYARREELERAGFPKPIPIANRWDHQMANQSMSGQGRFARALADHTAKAKLDPEFIRINAILSDGTVGIPATKPGNVACRMGGSVRHSRSRLSVDCAGHLNCRTKFWKETQFPFVSLRALTGRKVHLMVCHGRAH